tara:strand:+ start:310 stop:813 length:504 start_codon:yes stop_codon:yes gene_type:complete
MSAPTRTEQSGGGAPPTQPQTVGDNQPQPDNRILVLLENLVRANVILNHPNFNTLPESVRIQSLATYAHYRQQLIQSGYTQQQLNDILQQMQEAGQTQRLPSGGGRKSRKKRRKRKSRRKTKKKRRKTRNKKGGHHEAIVLGALALSKIFKKKKKKKKKKTRKKRRR